MRTAHSDLTQPPDRAASGATAMEAAEAFIADLRRWREVRGLSQKRLAAEMAYDPSYVSKIETGQQQPTHEFARRADEVLNAGGSLIRRCRDYTSSRPAQHGAHTPARLASDEAGSLALSLLVCHEEAQCRYVAGIYHLHIRRQLYNASDAPVTRYLIRIAVDRHPTSPDQSNELYRQRPLTWEEIGLRAWCEEEKLAGRPSTTATPLRRSGCCLKTSIASCRSTLAKAPGLSTATPSARTSGASGFSARSACRHSGSASSSSSRPTSIRPPGAPRRR